MSSVTFAGLSLEKPRIFGIINVTPDSFSDGGDALVLEDALRCGKAMLDAGADILDVGGESTRPGAAPVGIEDEIARAVPVVRGLSDLGAKVSIDTGHAPVMEAAIEAGATIINDVTALSHDPDSLDLAVASGLPVILMHMQGSPETMQQAPTYDHVALDVFDYLEARIEACEAAGIRRDRLIVDPGIGIGTSRERDLHIVRAVGLYHALGCPLLIGLSRKYFIARLSAGEAAEARLPGSLAGALHAISQGVQIVRVHDVRETVQAVKIWQAIESQMMAMDSS